MKLLTGVCCARRREAELHCAKCGGEIPGGAAACPGCGLKLKVAPNPPVSAMPPPAAGPPGAAPSAPPQAFGAPPTPEPPEYRPAPPPPGSPEFSQQGPPEYRAPDRTGDFAPPGGYAPGPSFDGPYYSPGELPPPGAYPRHGAPPAYPGGRTGAAEKGRFPWALVAIVVAGLLVIGGSAFVYFKFLKKTTYDGPQAVVARYFEILPGGDTDAIKALFAPDAQPSEANLSAIKMAGSMGASIKYENPRMKTLSKSATEASVQLVDLTVAVSVAGRSVKQNLSTFARGAKMVVALRKVNGQWLLLARNGAAPNLLNLPGQESGTVTAPPS